MELLITAGIAAVFGYVVGLTVAGRHSVRESEKSYLYGHVDGYAKAVRDGGEGDGNPSPLKMHLARTFGIPLKMLGPE